MKMAQSFREPHSSIHHKKALHHQPTNAESLPVPNLYGMLFYREKTLFITQVQAQQEDLHKANLQDHSISSNTFETVSLLWDIKVETLQ